MIVPVDGRGAVQAHERADSLSKDVQQLAMADVSAALPATVQVAVQSSLAQTLDSLPPDLGARLARLEAAAGTTGGAPPPATPTALCPVTPLPGADRVPGERPATAGMEPGRRAALQAMIAMAVDDLEGRLQERVQGHCAPLDEAVKRCAAPLFPLVQGAGQSHTT